ncbi:hypothetical protein HDU80_003128 [Chytriomyces hyalinus]|nr:hypothetical protein HDU80_003128 [Chytriomyces hyalinus]
MYNASTDTPEGWPISSRWNHEYHSPWHQSLLTFCLHGEKDGIRGVAESVLVGAVAKMGTGAFLLPSQSWLPWSQTRVEHKLDEMANIDETLEASLDIARLSIADSNDATVALSNQSCTPDEVDERDAEIKNLREELECERSLRQNAEKQLESCKQTIQNADERVAEIHSLRAHLEEAREEIRCLEVELARRRAIQQSILGDLRHPGRLKPETVVIIAFQTSDPEWWLKHIFSGDPWYSTYTFKGRSTLLKALPSWRPTMPEVVLSTYSMTRLLTMPRRAWLSVGSGNCTFEKALVRLTGSSFSRGLHAVGPSSPNWQTPNWVTDIPAELQF